MVAIQGYAEYRKLNSKSFSLRLPERAPRGNKRRRRRRPNCCTATILFLTTWVLYVGCLVHYFQLLSIRGMQRRFLKALHPPPKKKKKAVVQPPDCKVPFADNETEFSVHNITASNDILQKTVLIIATVPKDRQHVTALWSELECLTTGMDTIVLSAPLGSESILEPFAVEAVQRLELPLTVVYYPNDRYDVGLWCDALQQHLGYSAAATTTAHNHTTTTTSSTIAHTTVMLLNDSVYAIRPYQGLLHAMHITHPDKHLIGLSYSHTSKSMRNDKYWLESVYRGFSADGIRTFLRHSCGLSAHHRSFGGRFRAPWKRKRAIVRYHEIGLVQSFADPTVTTMGLFSSDAPGSTTTTTWVQNETLWRRLKDEESFPLAKVNQPYTRACAHNVCTRRLSTAFLDSLDFDAFATVPQQGRSRKSTFSS